LTIYPKQEPEEWAPVAEYPPINDATPQGLKRQPRLDWYESLKKLPTVDEKLYEISRHATHKIAHFNNWLPIYNSLPVAQSMTRTHFINNLPQSYQIKTGILPSDGESNLDSPEKVSESDSHESDTYVSRIRTLVLDQIAIEKYESDKLKGSYISKSIADGNRQQYVQNSLVQSLLVSLSRALSPDANRQLSEYQVDLSPAIRSWWYHSGYQPPNNNVHYRSRKDDQGRVSQMIQVDGRSALNLRSEHLIEPQIGLEDELVTDTSLIQDPVDKLGYCRAIHKFKWPVALPGFWFEDGPRRFDCPHTCFLTTDCLDLINSRNFNRATPLRGIEDALNSQAVLTAFSWLNSLAMFHGYTPFHEIDYPFTCQVITTDGQNWLFNVYQLNSHSFHRDFGGPVRNNVCWSSGLMKLYDSYEGNGKFSGLNDQVLELVVKFLSKQTNPTYTNSLKLRPLLGEDKRTEEEKNETRAALRRCIEGRTNRWLAKEWFVPTFEHLYFRSRESRGQIQLMKPYPHPPKPKHPIIFE